MARGKKKTHEEFVSELKQKNSNIEILSTYVNSNEKILCRCKIDGYEWYVRASAILASSKCPKCSNRSHKTHNDFLEEMNIKKPNIEILGKYINNHTKILCRCKLDDNKWYAKPHNLSLGCGCPVCYRDKKRKIQETFINELLYVNKNIEVIGNYINIDTKILCKCKIDGHTWNAIPYHLLNGHGCPKCNLSKGEKRIERYLINHNIEFFPQKTFDGLLGIGNGSLSYDFYIPIYNTLIEYQGEQHGKPIDFKGKGKINSLKNFKTQQEHDKRKREYAKHNNINLLEIWYYDFDNIEKILTKYFTHSVI